MLTSTRVLHPRPFAQTRDDDKMGLDDETVALIELIGFPIDVLSIAGNIFAAIAAFSVSANTAFLPLVATVLAHATSEQASREICNVIYGDSWGGNGYSQSVFALSSVFL